ncbi:MAG: PadR family transcriptional regulator, partial [Dehalococcoidia bacterium]|nr:PadR family transcriptional regulator [Dehalococcoidia bacterium]
MLKDFFLGFIKIHILYHASRDPIYGVEILEELGRHGYRLSPGTLYPTLHRLEKEGYLESRSKVVG